MKTASVLGFVPGIRDAAVAHAVSRDGETTVLAVLAVQADSDVTEHEAMETFRDLVQLHGIKIGIVVYEQTPYSKRKGEDRALRVRNKQLDLLKEMWPDAVHIPIPAWQWRNRFHLSRGSSPALVKERVELQTKREVETPNAAAAVAIAIWAAEREAFAKETTDG